MSMKEPSKRAISESLEEKYSEPYVVPETTIRDLILNLRIGEAHDAALCLLVIGEAVKAIVKDKTKSRELNLRLIKQIADEEKCRPIDSIIEAIIAAIGQGAEGIYATSLTITRFLEFAFEYQPDPSEAERLYKNEFGKIKRAAQRSR
ncbi:MAG: hypothetical protein AABO57_19320 [Acidobacteriota bacterium]